MKTTGATWKAYLASWPEGQWFDDSNETFDGIGNLDTDPKDDAVVEFTCGVVYEHQNLSGPEPKTWSLVSHFRKWEKSLTNTTLLVEVPKTKLEELKAWLNNNGGKPV